MCVARAYTVPCELSELRKEAYDSTGLRANHKLITPRMRCVSLANRHSRNARKFADDSVKQDKKGSRLAPLFACSFGISTSDAVATARALLGLGVLFGSVVTLCRFVMRVLAALVALDAMVRLCRAGSRGRRFLRNLLHRLYGQRNRGHSYQYSCHCQFCQSLFHLLFSPTEIPLLEKGYTNAEKSREAR